MFFFCQQGGLERFIELNLLASYLFDLTFWVRELVRERDGIVSYWAIGVC